MSLFTLKPAHFARGTEYLLVNDLLHVHQKIKYRICLLCNICVKLWEFEKMNCMKAAPTKCLLSETQYRLVLLTFHLIICSV
jgi:hypothetical protein